VARIIELHGGTVQVDPRPGGGALFTLRLPEPDRRPPRPDPSPSRAPAG
jgi:signal transduction histidine kinase